MCVRLRERKKERERERERCRGREIERASVRKRERKKVYTVFKGPIICFPRKQNTFCSAVFEIFF